MNIGFIGLGIMGEPMCKNIIRKGKDDKVFLYDLSDSKKTEFESLGAIWEDSSKSVVEKSDIIFSIIPKSEHVLALSKEILPVLKDGKIWVDMSTIDPQVSIDVSKEVSKTGAIMLDCPLVKSKAAAIDGTLGIYVGGDKGAFERVMELLLRMGNNVIHLGDNGAGLVMKACHNNLVAQIQNGVNETILLASKFGIDPKTFEKAISYGGGQNFYLSGKYKNIADNKYDTAFSVENMYKDVYIADRLAKECNLKLNGMENTKKVYDHAMEMDLGKEDFSATFKAVKDISDK